MESQCNVDRLLGRQPRICQNHVISNKMDEPKSIQFNLKVAQIAQAHEIQKLVTLDFQMLLILTNHALSLHGDQQHNTSNLLA